jgi:hypothetical protein
MSKTPKRKLKKLSAQGNQESYGEKMRRLLGDRETETRRVVKKKAKKKR